jgi:N-acetylmuramoyl-L-alanine amidase
MPKVFIGVGHGGKDPGAVANEFRESDLNLSIALACRDELERHGVTVLMSRTKDENDELTEEIKECNAFAPDLAADIHNNAGGGDGAEVLHSINGGKGKELAQDILDEIISIGQNSRGIKTRENSKGTDYYGFIRCTSCPAVIVECAFVDNRKDMDIIDTLEEQKKMGIAIAKGFLKRLGIEYTKPTSKLYRVQVGAYSQKSNAEATLKKLKADGYDGFVV